MKRPLLPACVLIAASFAASAAPPPQRPVPGAQAPTLPAGQPATVGAPAAGNASGIPDGALEVTATGTLEWLREDHMYVARQNAVATHNDTVLKGDVLVAYYTQPPGKKDSTQISQVTADGAVVTLSSPTAIAYGQHGVYDLTKHMALLLGDNLKLVTTDEVVTAKDSLEYFEDIATGVARGDAVMVRGEDRLTADVIAAKFTQPPKDDNGKKTNDKPQTAAATPPGTAGANGDGKKKNALERLDAKGHVVLTTPTDIVTGNEGVYNPVTDQATVIGDVHVTRDQNQLNGNRAEVDMATGISRVYAAPDAKVRGLFIPKKKDKSGNGDDSDHSDDSDASGNKPTGTAETSTAPAGAAPAGAAHAEADTAQ